MANTIKYIAKKVSTAIDESAYSKVPIGADAVNIDRSNGTTVEASLVNLEQNKASLASPVLTGTPTVPTATAGTNTTQAASCAFVNTALSRKAENKEYTATITTTWIGSTAPFTQDISIPGILATDNPIVDVGLSTTLATALLQEKEWGYISKITTGTDKITVTCNKKKPTVAIPIRVKVVK